MDYTAQTNNKVTTEVSDSDLLRSLASKLHEIDRIYAMEDKDGEDKNALLLAYMDKISDTCKPSSLRRIANDLRDKESKTSVPGLYKEKCCDGQCGSKATYANQVCMPINGKVVCIDKCIHHIVAALNAGGVETVASCCGHGKEAGRIDLRDGRIIIVTKK